MNLWMVFFYGRGFMRFGNDYLATGSISSLLCVFFFAELILFSFIRTYPRDVSWKPLEWFTAIGGTIVTTFADPNSANTPIIGELIQGTGLLITIYALLSLNRSFAIIPANRGIKTGGMYRFVRHPLYMGYCVFDLGTLISQFSWWNLMVISLAAICMIGRIYYEEKFLLRDASYRQFCQTTRYRLVPKLW